MWGSAAAWMEKAKEAAANLDQQLNESVGVDTNIPAKPSTLAAGGTETDATSAWNDDDFKFDDDDDDEVENQQQTAVPEVAAAAASSAPATPQKAVKEEVPPAAAAATPSAPTAAAPAVAETEKAVPVEGGSWAEDDNTDFDNFDGVAPQEGAEPKQQPGSPSSMAAGTGGFAGALGVNLGGLGQKVQQAAAATASTVKPAAVKPNDINFMSPFSSLMTSISQDQDQKKEDKEEKPTTPPPDTPVKSEALSAQETTGTVVPAASQDDTESAWQEEDIDLDDDDDQPAEAEAQPPKAEEAQQEEEIVKEEKKVEEKPAEVVPQKVNEPNQQQQQAEEEKTVKEASPTATAVEAQPPKAAPPADEAPAPAPQEQPPAPAHDSAKAEEAASPSSPDEASQSTGTPAAVADVADVAELEQIKKLLTQREEQLAAKAEQMFQLQQMYEKEKQELQKKVADTKDEAKKRILKARERCEAAEAKLQASTSALTEDAAQQAELVAALREEGQKLAQKQADMERTVRAARGEARELKEHLEDEIAAKEDGLAKIEQLQNDLKSTQEQLSSARKGETQAGVLDIELQKAREDISNKENTIMSLEANVKELKAEKKALMEEVEISQQGMAEENLRESKKLRKEHNAAVTDLEAKLQTSEREAAVREDQLRHEVEELRKRWQDAVRRADALSMDVQSSTAPLLRQLESMERQHRARASAAAELETKLRAELEETVIQNEKLSKDHSELKTKFGRVERLSKEQQNDLADRQKTIDEMTTKIARLEEKLQKLQIDGEKRQEEYEKVERLANEGVSKVRSEMSQAVLDSEERYRSQLETMKEELRIEQEKRSQLEKQVDELLENAAVIIPNPSNEFVKESKPAKLVESEGQAQILSGALRGLGGDSDEDDDNTDDEDLVVPKLQHQSSTGSSYAALEQLTQNLKTAKKELETLRKSLAESEKTRESLVEELGESREAKEKLPLFEAKVKELMADNREKELEIRGLQDDIADVKEMYRTQMSILLEEKAAAFASVAKEQMNGSSNESPEEEPQEAEQVPELVEDALGIS